MKWLLIIGLFSRYGQGGDTYKVTVPMPNEMVCEAVLTGIEMGVRLQGPAGVPRTVDILAAFCEEAGK